MSKCYNCGSEFTLKNEEVRCDNCKKKVNFPCHNCGKWFSISDEENNKIKECKVCGFFVCPNCGTCGPNCQKNNWYVELKKIIQNDSIIKKVIEFIEEIKLNKDQKSCLRGVPISYAKGRIKSCFVRMQGFRIKNDLDLQRFKERVKQVTDLEINPLGKQFTINQTREAGSYGQEYRDVFNYLICKGKIKPIKIKKIVGDKEIEYNGFERIETSDCPLFDAKDLIQKECPNKKCKIGIYPLSEIECCCPECKYKKGKNKGQFYKLKLKISNKDICQLNCGDFKKEEDKDDRNRLR